MIPGQGTPIAVGASAEGRSNFCLLLGSQIEDFQRNPSEWSCEGINRARHVHVGADTLARLIQQRRATVLDEARHVIALTAAESSEGEAA